MFRVLLVTLLAWAVMFSGVQTAQSKSRKETQKDRARVVQYSKRFMGTPYVWGGTGPRSFDCSGFIRWVYGKVTGYWLPHNAAAQASVTRQAHGKLRRGDLLFFQDSIGHVGMYIGGGKFIHASSGAGKVTIRVLSGWYRSQLVGAHRVLNGA